MNSPPSTPSSLRPYFPALRAALGYGPDTPSFDDRRRLGMARDLAARLAWIPGLRMVGVGNSVAMYGSGPDSDVDLFVVAEPGRIWLVRALVTLYVAIFARRKTRSSHRDSFCLSFFATTEGMDFSEFAIERDIYLAYWVSTMKPVWDLHGTYPLFVAANRHWHEVSPEEITANTAALPTPTNPSHERLPWLWNGLDRLVRDLVRPRTLRSYERLGRPYGIRVSDKLLKFHDDDRRVELRDVVLGTD
jgi:hypothetical protein